MELHQSEEEKVVIEADENLLGFISIMNSGKTLFIMSEPGYRKPEFSSLVVRVYFRQITKLNIYCDEAVVTSKNTISLTSPLEAKITGKCDVVLELDVPVLKMLIQNQGDVTLYGKCTGAGIKTQSAGNLFAKELITDDLKLRNMSDGNVEVFADSTISIAQYGEGFVHYYGNARLSDVDQKGNGVIKHIK